MKAKWIPAALLAAALLPGCTSDREKLTGPPPDAPAPPEASAPGPEPKPSGRKPAKVDESKFKTSSTGLKHAILKPGSGPEVKTHQEAVVHYTGWLTNGTEFDSSHNRGEPYPVVIDESSVIPGWHEGLKGMKVGELRQLVIPPDLAYGPEGRGEIPPNATLIFEVELMKIGEHSH